MNNSTINNTPLSEKQKLFAKWELYQRCINEINTYPIHEILFKRLLDEETTQKGRARIIYTFILSYHINEWFVIETLTMQDILQYIKNKDFLSQFNTNNNELTN